MRTTHGMAGLLLAGLVIAIAPAALADSQSSNSSSNCSGGRCTTWQSYVEENGRGRRGWTGYHAWPEGPFHGGWRPGWEDRRWYARPWRERRGEWRRGDDDDGPRWRGRRGGGDGDD
jgi:hypothetical protein